MKYCLKCGNYFDGDFRAYCKLKEEEIWVKKKEDEHKCNCNGKCGDGCKCKSTKQK